MPPPAIRPVRRLLIVLTALVAVLAAAGCSDSSTSTTTSDTSGAQRVAVVASTDVWGDVVKQVGGDRVTVTALISGGDLDPHSYQANAQGQLAISKAGLVVKNGGGYDDFVDTMLASSGGSATVVDAVQASGKTADGGELNEHVWYDFPSVRKVAQQIATDLTALDPAGAAGYTARLATFTGKLDALTTATTAIADVSGGTAVAVTEPVPLYLIEAAGLVDKTPEGFSEAVENGTDVPVSVLNDTVALFTDGAVRALVYNEQTTGPQTDLVLKAAKDSGVAVVPVTETLPAGQDYLSWMTANVNALRAAVAP